MKVLSPPSTQFDNPMILIVSGSLLSKSLSVWDLRSLISHLNTQERLYCKVTFRKFMEQEMNILFAEDSPYYRRALCTLLKDEIPNLNIVEVPDENSAVEHYSPSLFSLVITDMRMLSDRGGNMVLGAVQNFCKQQECEQTPVILLTTDDTGAAEGFSLKLSKFSTPSDIVNEIRRFIG